MFKAQDNAAIVAALRSRRPPMRVEFQQVFDHFEGRDVAIVGSSLRDFDSAHDIDVLFLAGQDFRQLAKDLGLRYLGKFRGPLTGGDVRRLSTFAIDGVPKPIQCISDSSVASFDQWSHMVLLRDGQTLNDGKHHTKQAA